MISSKTIFLTSVTTIILVLVSVGLPHAQTTYNNNNALKNITRSNIYFDIAYDDFLPEVDIVGNGYISLIGYQNQGYAVVPMD